MPTVPDKQCNKCGEWFEASAKYFHRDSHKPDGFATFCKPCKRAANNAYNEKHRKRNAERARNWYAENRERGLETRRRYSKDNAEQISEYRREKYWADPESARAAVREWAQANPQKVLAQTRKKRATKRNAEGSHTADDVFQQLEAQKGRCWWCEKKLGADYHVDHRIPLSKGGSNGPENLVIAHPSCNMSKKALMPWEFMEGRLL